MDSPGPEQGPDAAVEGSGEPAPNHIPRHRYVELQKALATGEVKRTVLARRYGVSPQAITQFAKRYRWEIDQIRGHVDEALAGLWISSKDNRLAAYQGEYEASLANEFYSNHYEHVKTRAAILRAVADELGDIPNKSQLTIGGTVRHELVGIDVDECFPEAAGAEAGTDPAGG